MSRQLTVRQAINGQNSMLVVPKDSAGLTQTILWGKEQKLLRFFAATYFAYLWVQTVGQYHLGEFVNRFRHGSLVMKLPDSEAAKIPTVLFGTINGSIGVIASLPQQQFQFLSRLQVRQSRPPDALQLSAARLLVTLLFCCQHGLHPGLPACLQMVFKVPWLPLVNG